MYGEEKGSRAELESATKELTEKLHSWNVLLMGEVPFLFCYAAGADLVQFYVLCPDMTLRTIHERPLVVSNVVGVLQLYVAVINIFRILQTLQRSIPLLSSPMPFSTLSRSDCNIVFEMDCVVKIYHTADDSKRDKFFGKLRGPFADTDLQRLATLFSHLFKLTPRPDCMEVPVTPHSAIAGKSMSTLTVRMSPVGIQRVPNTKQEFICFLRCALRALIILHKIGYVHCDVRWPNFITAPLSGHLALGVRWCLIDYGETKRISGDIKPQHDLLQLADMLVDPTMSLLRGFDVPIRLCELLRKPKATAAGVLAELVKWVT